MMLNEEKVEGKILSQGENVKFLREFFGIKQVAFAQSIGRPQSYVSVLEQQEVIDDDMLELCAKALGVTVKVLKELDPKKMVRSNIYNIEKIEHSSGFLSGSDQENHFYPIEKIMELNKQNAELYERLLKAEQEKVALLEKKLSEKGQK